MEDKLFHEIDPTAIEGNVFKMIEAQWFLITAGRMDNFNTMTANWGSLGYLWKKPITHIFVRPTRYTFSFMESCEFYTLSFLGEQYRDILNFCGKFSGRDINKIESTGLTPLEGNYGEIFFEQAELVVVCRKLYYSDINPDHFIDTGIDRNYPRKDYHRMYIGEIVRCLVKNQENLQI
jgi:flavin reductase (DIM6/NTAB) family NADH-FMN oxidoreductase RutF